jgi:hypothetical protein
MSETKKWVMDTGRRAAQAEPQRLKVAFHEANEPADPQPVAAHYLVLDGQRLGRDLELYEVMGGIVGWPRTLPLMLTEIVLPLRHAAPDAAKIFAKALENKGREFYPEELFDEWKDIIDEAVPPNGDIEADEHGPTGWRN